MKELRLTKTGAEYIRAVTALLESGDYKIVTDDWKALKKVVENKLNNQK